MNGARDACTPGPLGNESVPPHHFEARYRAQPDPWGYETSEYEYDKYQATLDALPRTRYRSAFEIGCSIGVFTALLAERCRMMPWVRIERLRVPDAFPADSFDLIVVSEVGYYWSEGDL